MESVRDKQIPLYDKNVVLYFNFIIAQSTKIHQREALDLVGILGEIGGTIEILFVVIPFLISTYQERNFIFSFIDKLEGNKEQENFFKPFWFCLLKRTKTTKKENI